MLPSTTTMNAQSSGPRQERRQVGRPQNGDRRPCRKCGAPPEFSERYRFGGEVVPAWVCDSPACRDRDIVRRTGAQIANESRKRIRAANALRANVSRTMMRSRARVDRTGDAVERTDSNLRRKPKK